MWDIINLIIWAIAGVSTLTVSVISKEDIPRFLYGITWFCLMLKLIEDCVSSIA